MAIPTFQEVMLPILQIVKQEDAKSLQTIVEQIEGEFALTPEERQQRVPSGKQRTIYNRITWALTHMRKAGLVEFRGKRGTYGITEAGIELLATQPDTINLKLLNNYDEYRAFRQVEQTPELEPAIAAQSFALQSLAETDPTQETPEETIGRLADELELQLANDLLDEISTHSPDFFETLVVDLLLKMGYGGLEGSGTVTRSTGDGGIDGIITQDALGLDVIYIQAKKWEKSSKVSRPDIQKFAGALSGEGVTKGVFMTTARFAAPAIEFAKANKNSKIILMDGLMLVKLMIKYNLGVNTSNTIKLKKIDSDYFAE